MLQAHDTFGGGEVEKIVTPECKFSNAFNEDGIMGEVEGCNISSGPHQFVREKEEYEYNEDENMSENNGVESESGGYCGIDEESSEDEGKTDVPPTGNDLCLLCNEDATSHEPAVICIDIFSKLRALLTSAVYHRVAVGHAGLVIGIGRAERSGTVHLILAWPSQNIPEEDNLPTVNFWSGCQFDLRKPLEAMRLVFFLYKARQVPFMLFSTSNLRTHLPWRADLHSSSLSARFLKMLDIESSKDRVKRWLEGIYTSEIGASPPVCYHHNTTATPKHSQPAFSEPHNTKQINSTVSDTVKPYSSSNFARDAKNRDGRSCFFLCRYVVFCSVREGHRLAPIPKQYADYITLLWLRGIDSESLLYDLAPTPDVQEVVHELWEHMIQLSEQKRVAVEMDKQIDSIIRSSFPDLMRICAEARTVRAGGLVLGANEMTFRQLFDDLAKFVLKSSGAKDVAFVKEGALRYFIRGGDDRDYLVKFYNEALPINTSNPIDPCHVYWAIQTIDDDPNVNRKDLRMKEPTEGRMDGIILLTIDGVHRDKAATYDYCIWKPSVSSTTKRSSPAPVTTARVPQRKVHQYGLGTQELFSQNHSPFLRPQYPNILVISPSSAPSLGLPSAIALPTAAHVYAPNDLSGENPLERPSESSIAGGPLWLPIVTLEYKKEIDGSEGQASIFQNQMYLASISTFMARFGIQNLPVFGIVTNRCRVILSCAWAKQVISNDGTLNQQGIFIADENADIFDLTNPVDVLNVATFIAFVIQEHAETLRQLFKKDGIDESLQKKYLIDPNSEAGLPYFIAQNMLSKSARESSGEEWVPWYRNEIVSRKKKKQDS